MDTIVVDARGEACPLPVVKTVKAIGTLTGPALVEVHVDNEIAVQNVLRMAQGKGFAAKSEQKEEKHFVITVEADKTEGDGAEQVAETACLPDQRGDVVVAVGTAVMGGGDDQLGAILMKSFLYALTQQEKLPKTILFYNGGAHLTTEGSASLEDIKTLAAQGVEIFTCGTCLDFYGLKDKLAVGGVTNMYSIVETLSKAAKVIRP